MNLVLTADGDVNPVEPENGKDFSLKELKSHIGGGYIEIVPVDDDHYMVCDEDGQAKELPLNPLANILYGPRLGFIVGDVLVCERDKIK